MTTWKQALREGSVSGSIASVLSAGYLVLAGKRRGQPAAPVNAVSHWFFGNRSLRQDEPSLLYTLTGYLTHHGASLFWAVLHARYWAAQPDHKKPLPAVAGAVAASGVAYFVDYNLTPQRLTPGYEHRVDSRELANVYACFAAGLLIGTLLLRGRR